MLVKVGRFYLTLGTFALFTSDNGFHDLILAGNLPIKFDRTEGVEIARILDEAIANQQTLQSQIEAVNKQHAELQAKAQEIAAYEQQLMQKAAQLDMAAAGQSKSPILMPGFGRKRG